MANPKWEEAIVNKDSCPIYKLIKLFQQVLEEEGRSIRWFHTNYMVDTEYTYQATHNFTRFRKTVISEDFIDGVMRYLLDVRSGERGKVTKFNSFRRTIRITKKDIKMFLEVYNGNKR